MKLKNCVVATTFLLYNYYRRYATMKELRDLYLLFMFLLRLFFDELKKKMWRLK